MRLHVSLYLFFQITFQSGCGLFSPKGAPTLEENKLQMGKSELLENSAIKLRTLWNNMIIAVDHAEMDFQFALVNLMIITLIISQMRLIIILITDD